LVLINEALLDKAFLIDLLKPLVVAGIPAFNEEKTIAKVVTSAQKYADIVVVCDDGSLDMTREIAERLGAEVVCHKRNLGYGAALQSLFKKARELKADILVTIDSDGQHNAEEIPFLVKPIEEGTAQVVFGSRFIDEAGTADMPLYRKIGIKVITNLANGSAKNNISDSQSGFRAYSKQALEYLSVSDTGMGASLELLRAVDKSGMKVCEVPISCNYNVDGVNTSTKNPITHGLGLVISIAKLLVNERPLQYLGLPGLVSLTSGILLRICMLTLFEETIGIAFDITFASIVFTLAGGFLISTAITLRAIKRKAYQTSKIPKSTFRNRGEPV
jgi:glycosyltransferase involved in cell wall biosynthesis